MKKKKESWVNGKDYKQNFTYCWENVTDEIYLPLTIFFAQSLYTCS